MCATAAATARGVGAYEIGLGDTPGTGSHAELQKTIGYLYSDTPCSKVRRVKEYVTNEQIFYIESLIVFFKCSAQISVFSLKSSFPMRANM